MPCARAMQKLGYFGPVFLDTAAVPRPLLLFGQIWLYIFIVPAAVHHFFPSSPSTPFSYPMGLSIGNTVFYTCSNGVQCPARVVETALEGFAPLEYYQYVAKVVNRYSKIDSIDSPSQVPSHHLTAHPALDLDLVDGLQGVHGKANSQLGYAYDGRCARTVCALCRNAPFITMGCAVLFHTFPSCCRTWPCAQHRSRPVVMWPLLCTLVEPLQPWGMQQARLRSSQMPVFLRVVCAVCQQQRNVDKVTTP